ncbi:unnamed protein product, partial [marine sediment metagenome]
MGYPLGCYAINYFNWKGIPAVLRCSGEDIQKDVTIPYGYRLNPRVDHLVEKSYVRYDALVANSNTVRDLYLELGVKNERVRTIPNGVDWRRIENVKGNSEEIRKRHGAEGKKIILTVGRNHPKKAYYLIPEIIRYLLDCRNDFIWIIIGLNTRSIYDLASSGGVGEYVVAVEEIRVSGSNDSIQSPADEVIEYYKSADVL